MQATGAGGAKRQGLAPPARYMRKKQRIREPACLEEARCLDGLHAQRSILIAHTVLQAGLEKQKHVEALFQGMPNQVLSSEDTERPCTTVAERVAFQTPALSPTPPWDQCRSALLPAGTSLLGQA